MRNKKLMAAIPMVATLIAPMTAFAATSYTTTNESVTNVTSAITADADTNQVDVSVTQGSTFSVTIPKTIVLNGKVNEDNQATYKVTVSGNIASNETINVVPSGSGTDASNNPTFAMKDSAKVKSDLTATIKQTVTKFVDKQVTTSASDTAKLEAQTSGDDKTTIEGTVTIANLTSGSWTGNFNFAISLSAS
jgi:hypothetical protein